MYLNVDGDDLYQKVARKLKSYLFFFSFRSIRIETLQVREL